MARGTRWFELIKRERDIIIIIIILLLLLLLLLNLIYTETEGWWVLERGGGGVVYLWLVSLAQHPSSAGVVKGRDNSSKG